LIDEEIRKKIDKDKRAINYLVENITCISGIVDFNGLD
jgi:hypothetical protein